MATTKITNPELFDLGSLNTALRLPSGTTADRPTSPSTGEWRYNTDNNLIEYYDGGSWRELQSEDLPPVPSEHFNTVLYTGNGSTQSITGVGFQPDFVWIKMRDAAEWHQLMDSSRGATETLYSNATNAQTSDTTGLTSFDSDGFTIGASTGFNQSGKNLVAWCWKANGGTTSSNTDGSITSTVQVNQKAGFSIVKYTGDGGVDTIGHGLSAAPEMIIVKSLGHSASWYTYHIGLDASNPEDYNVRLNQTNARQDSASYWNDTAPTSSVFTIGTTTGVSQSGTDFIAYCFHSVAGYSKFGTYTGTGAAGNAQNTGFEPAFVLIKRTDSSGAWSLYDNKRNTTNPRNLKLVPNSSAVENVAGTTYQLNFFTNGFEFLGGGSDLNASGGTFIYIAFAADPSTAPVLADSFGVETYQGNGGTQSLAGYGFTPSMIWFKARAVAYDHGLYDSVRGGGSLLFPDLTQAASTVTNGVLSFDSSGVTIGANNKQNASDSTYVGWAWKANSIPTINTDGTIQSVVSANQTAGFSIIKYTANGNNNSTIGHGLSANPEFIITKRLDSNASGGNWYIYSSVLGTTKTLVLNGTNAQISTSNSYLSVGSTTYEIGTNGDMNTNGGDFIAYCFHSVNSFSKFDSYTGNSTSTSVTTGFQPGFVMLKRIDAIGNWNIWDSERNGSSSSNDVLYANKADAETDAGSGRYITFDSNGFTIYGDSGDSNASGHTYLYMAFKENPAQPAIPSGEMAYLVVAGGGGSNQGAGGAGGLRTSYGPTSGGGASSESNITLAAGTYTITVGSGGAAGSGNGAVAGSNGGDSVFSTITSSGGGGGGAGGVTIDGVLGKGRDGGSGGGGGQLGTGTATGGLAVTSPVVQGFAGGSNGGYNAPNYPGGGGGGASVLGGNATSGSVAGDGGNGLTVSITGTSTIYAGGGGGGINYQSGTVGTGGFGGGGNGTIGTTVPQSGTANTGGGAGGSGQSGAAGGSGIVILRLNTSDYSGVTTGSPTVTTVGSETILTYTGSGTYVHS